MPTTRSLIYSTVVSHVSSGNTSLAPGAFSTSMDATLTSANTGRYPLADISLHLLVNTTVSLASNTIMLYRRDMDVNGSTADSPMPQSSYSAKLVGAFIAPVLNTSNSSCWLMLADVPLTDACEFFIENRLNATITTGWKLYVRPKSDSFS